MHPQRRGEAVHQEIDLAQVGDDGGHHLFAHLIGKGIAVESARIDAAPLGSGLEGTVVVQPALAVRLALGAFSKEMPMVLAPQPNAASMREAKPKPPEQPITNAFLAPAMAPRAATAAI